MKRTSIVLVAGLAAGLAAHVSWFQARRPESPDKLEAQLTWMQAQLELSASQYAQLKELHEQLRPQLSALSQEVGRLRGELVSFEQQRVTAGQIDFLEFARYVEERRNVDQASNEATRRLVDAAVDVMTPEQRERYLSILAPVLSETDATTYH